MGGFDRDVINLGPRPQGMSGTTPHLLLPGLDPAIVRQNTEKFVAACTELSARGGILIVPPGRFYLGAPAGSNVITTPATLRLHFMPTAVLVPMADVVLEITSHIRAGARQIFDLFIEEIRVDDPTVTVPPRRAGPVRVLTPVLPAVYPEWWGALATGAVPAQPNDAVVRRTTLALQTAIDTAHGVALAARRDGPPVRSHAVPLLLSGEYVIDDELTVGNRIDPGTGNAAPLGRPDIQGMIIQGLRSAASGAMGSAARLVASPRSAAFTREPASGSIEATQAFTPAPGMQAVVGAVSAPTTYARRALLGIRSAFGVLVEDVGFDARFTAARCVSVEHLDGGAAHHVAFVGCAFANARAELLHLGGEYLRLGLAAGEPPGTPRIVVLPERRMDGSLHGTGTQDLSNLRLEDCTFDTDAQGALVDASGARNPRVTNLVGVVLRANQSLGVEVRNCRFAGPANPMVHLIGGRMSLVSCQFSTRRVPDATPMMRSSPPPLADTNGADIFFDAPRRERFVVDASTRPVDVRVQLGAMTARDVTSDSAVFLTSYVSASYVGEVGIPSQAAVVLRGVRHAPSGKASAPSVYWDGMASANCPLVLHDCALGGGGGQGAVYLGASGVAEVTNLGCTVAGARLFRFAQGIARLRIRSVQ